MRRAPIVATPAASGDKDRSPRPAKAAGGLHGGLFMWKFQTRLAWAAGATLLLALSACGGSTTDDDPGQDSGADVGAAIEAGNAGDVGPSTGADGGADAGPSTRADGVGDAGLLNDASQDVAKATTPSVLGQSPLPGAVDIAHNTSVSVTFSEAMATGTLKAASFFLTSGTPPVAVPATLGYGNTTAVLWPVAHLAPNTKYTATVTTGAQSAHGVGLAAKHVWFFTTGAKAPTLLPVNLGTAGNFAILAKSAVSTVPPAAVTGNLGISPAAATYITGFSLTADTTGVFSSSPQVTGKVYAADYAVPTPANMTTAIGDMELAYTDAGARPPDVTELAAGNIGGKTLAPGVYKWGSGVLIPADVTLQGSAKDVWIFQVAQDLTVASGAKVHLTGGALAKHVFWQVAGFVDLGTTAHLEGVVLCKSEIALHTGASVNGRLLAQTAVNIDASVVAEPAP